MTLVCVACGGTAESRGCIYSMADTWRHDLMVPCPKQPPRPLAIKCLLALRAMFGWFGDRADDAHDWAGDRAGDLGHDFDGEGR